MKFRIYLSNFHYYAPKEAATKEQAIEIAKKTGFNCRIELWPTDNEMHASLVGVWDVIGGYRSRNREPIAYPGEDTERVLRICRGEA